MEPRMPRLRTDAVASVSGSSSTAVLARATAGD
jgi:hypothetical protein